MTKKILAWERDGDEIRFPHVQTKDHRFEYISGAIAAGPMNDGPTMLILYREVLPALTEVVEVNKEAEDGTSLVMSSKGVIPVEGALREDVVTLVLTQNGVEQLQRVLTSHLEKLRQSNQE